MPSRKARREDDGRLARNRPPERQKRVKPVEEKTRWQQLIDGDISVEDLTDEEVRRGKCMDKNGQFRSRPPKEFPRQLHDALHAEFQKRVDESFLPTVEIARQTLLEVAQNKRAAGPARVRAAEILLERGVGKVVDRKQLEVTMSKFQEDFEGILVDVDDEDNVYRITDMKKDAK